MRILQWLIWCLVALVLAPEANAQTLTFTNLGIHSFTVPSGPPTPQQILIGVYGNGSDISNGNQGGAAGGFCESLLPVHGGQTIFYQVGADNHTQGNPGSWVNISSNVAPTMSSQGCFAQGSNQSTNFCTSVCSGVFGNVLNTSSGPLGPAPGAPANNAGGPGAGGPGGNGQTNSGVTGGAGGAGANGFPAGGKGGNGCFGGGGGGIGGGTAATPAGFPGGGGGGNCGNPGFFAGGTSGANGMVVVQFVFTPPVSSSASQMFLTWPG
jgi:hypothetical protein